MPDSWKPVEVIVSDDMQLPQVIDQINARIRIIAGEAGDFVQRIRIDAAQPHSPGWRRWLVAYLAGPPGAFPSVGPELPPVVSRDDVLPCG